MLFSTKKTQFVPFWVIVTRFLKWRTRQEHSISSLIASVTPEQNLFADYDQPPDTDWDGGSSAQDVGWFAHRVCFFIPVKTSKKLCSRSCHNQHYLLATLKVSSLKSTIQYNTNKTTRTHHKPQTQQSESYQNHIRIIRTPLMPQTPTSNAPTAQVLRYLWFPWVASAWWLHRKSMEITFWEFLGCLSLWETLNWFSILVLSAAETHRLSVDPQTLGEAVGQSTF